jgi:putative ABC transport system permease protein
LSQEPTHAATFTHSHGLDLMNAKEALSLALRSLRANKLRSILTMIGIIIGVTAVVVLVGLGNGMKSGFSKAFGELATAVFVNKSQGAVPGAVPAKDLKDSDVIALRKLPSIRSATPLLQGSTVFQRGTGIQFRGQITGSTTEFLGVNNRELILGSMFTEDDEKVRRKVVLLGPNVVTKLYNGDAGAALGSNIRIAKTTFSVIGVLKSDGHFDDIGLMPLSTARAYLLGGDDTVTSIAAKATSVDQVPAAVDDITRLLSDRHHIDEVAKRDFTVTALQEQLDKINQFMSFLSLFIVAIAAISLVVGGIGVANIMLVSVTERTREIGIRKAIGAPRRAIMKQFLLESTVLAGIGGVVGALLGVTITLVAGRTLPEMIPNFGAPTVSVAAIAIAMGVSLGIGVVAGGYPALRASRMRPIEALRYQ